MFLLAVYGRPLLSVQLEENIWPCSRLIVAWNGYDVVWMSCKPSSQAKFCIKIIPGPLNGQQDDTGSSFVLKNSLIYTTTTLWIWCRVVFRLCKLSRREKRLQRPWPSLWDGYRSRTICRKLNFSYGLPSLTYHNPWLMELRDLVRSYYSTVTTMGSFTAWHMVSLVTDLWYNVYVFRTENE